MSNRPRELDAEVIRGAVMAILRFVKAWLDEGDVDDRELVDMLVGAVERAGSLDAYLIASSLDRNYH